VEDCFLCGKARAFLPDDFFSQGFTKLWAYIWQILTLSKSVISKKFLPQRK
jgi:hypothetical protein